MPRIHSRRAAWKVFSQNQITHLKKLYFKPFNFNRRLLYGENSIRIHLTPIFVLFFKEVFNKSPKFFLWDEIKAFIFFLEGSFTVLHISSFFVRALVLRRLYLLRVMHRLPLRYFNRLLALFYSPGNLFILKQND